MVSFWFSSLLFVLACSQCTPTPISPAFNASMALVQMLPLKTHVLAVGRNLSISYFLFAIEYATGLRTLVEGSGLLSQVITSPNQEYALLHFDDRRLLRSNAIGSSMNQINPPGVVASLASSISFAFFTADSNTVCFHDLRNVSTAGLYCAANQGRSPPIRVSLPSHAGGGITSVNFASDNQTVVFVVSLSGFSYLCIASVGQTEAARVLLSRPDLTTPSIPLAIVSPDGATVAFIQKTGPSVAVMYSMDVATGTLLDLSSSVTLQPREAAWSLEGTRIAFNDDYTWFASGKRATESCWIFVLLVFQLREWREPHFECRRILERVWAPLFKW